MKKINLYVTKHLKDLEMLVFQNVQIKRPKTEHDKTKHAMRRKPDAMTKAMLMCL